MMKWSKWNGRHRPICTLNSADVRVDSREAKLKSIRSAVRLTNWRWSSRARGADGWLSPFPLHFPTARVSISLLTPSFNQICETQVKWKNL